MDVSSVTNMQSLRSLRARKFNGELNDWDIHVRNMYYMFHYAMTSTKISISGHRVSRICITCLSTPMTSTARLVRDVSQVTTMRYMFRYCWLISTRISRRHIESCGHGLHVLRCSFICSDLSDWTGRPSQTIKAKCSVELLRSNRSIGVLTNQGPPTWCQ